MGSRTSLRPWTTVYRLSYKGFGEGLPDYEGTPLPSIRRQAERIAREHGARVSDPTARGPGHADRARVIDALATVAKMQARVEAGRWDAADVELNADLPAGAGAIDVPKEDRHA